MKRKFELYCLECGKKGYHAYIYFLLFVILGGEIAVLIIKSL